MCFKFSEQLVEVKESVIHEGYCSRAIRGLTRDQRKAADDLIIASRFLFDLDSNLEVIVGAAQNRDDHLM